jgi:N-carbamoyl-L-amino-acid hydrolase
MPSFEPDVPLERILEHFQVLGRIGNLGPSPLHGFLRAAWSFEESAAMEYFRQVGVETGLHTAYDGVGNLYLTTPGRRDRLVQIGSHLDTVPMGGTYDGAVGIVAGMEAILALQSFWSQLSHSLQLVIWRGEESATFGAVCKGSQAAFGLNDPKILSKDFEGQTLEAAILSQGYDPEFIANQHPTLPQTSIDAIEAHIEVHIEQANRLQVDECLIGIATSIRGAMRLRVLVSGEAAHSGATPMGASYRRDANLAMAYMLVALDRLAQEQLAQGHDLVQTVGVINSDSSYNLHDPRVYENALTKVSPFGYFALDIRSNRQSFLNDYVGQARQLVQSIAENYRVSVRFEEITALPPLEALDARLQTHIASACQALNLAYEHIPSGALHDVAVVASQRHSDGTIIPGGLIFIPCRDGVSHNPREYAAPEAIQAGAKVLALTLVQIAL